MLKEVRSIHFPDRIQKFSEIVEISRGSEFELVEHVRLLFLAERLIKKMACQLLVMLV